jgi:hypothetical protein
MEMRQTKIKPTNLSFQCLYFTKKSMFLTIDTEEKESQGTKEIQKGKRESQEEVWECGPYYCNCEERLEYLWSDLGVSLSLSSIVEISPPNVSLETHRSRHRSHNHDVRDYFTQATNTKLTFLNDIYLKDKEFVVGRKLSMADVYLYICFSWSGSLNIDLTNYPVVNDEVFHESPLDLQTIMASRTLTEGQSISHCNSITY